MSGDFAVRQTIETVEQEGLPGFFGQTFKQSGDSLEYLQRSVNGFRAGNTRLVGMQRQRIQISAFDLAASGTSISRRVAVVARKARGSLRLSGSVRVRIRTKAS